MLLSKIFSWLLFGLLIVALVFVWKSVVLPCEKPLEYALGAFDTRFGISRDDFLQALAASEKPWEKAVGKELFVYSPQAPFKINLIFDERQRQTLEAKQLSAALQSTQNTQESLSQKQDQILTAYRKGEQEYASMLAAFKKQLSAYNAEVERWNKQGGAPPEEYRNLQAVSLALEKSRSALEEKRTLVNTLATQVNGFSKQQVAVVGEYNDLVEQYVQEYGATKEFDQGEYVESEINIYQFDDNAHLEAVLVHEFGHALGLLHGSDPQSIMYPMMDKQALNPLSLSSEDKSLVLARCHINTWDIVLQSLEGWAARIQARR